MQPVVRFFESLPPKVCSRCHEVLEEMADCYPNVCPNCEDNAYYPSRPEMNVQPAASPMGKTASLEGTRFFSARQKKYQK